jgi:murein DD-endopeptidase MepM/ murein hydrolase activator NlpD
MLTLQFPLRGDILVLNPPGHHRFAFDCTLAHGRRLLHCSTLKWLRGRAWRTDWIGWGARIYAPLDAIVLSARDDVADRETFAPARDLWTAFVRDPWVHRRDPMALAGNHIVLRAGRVEVLLAHLRQRSLRVAVGQIVNTGQVIGDIGASGNVVAPHLHLETREGPILEGSPLPFIVASLGRPLGRFEWIHMNGVVFPESGLGSPARRGPK